MCQTPDQIFDSVAARWANKEFLMKNKRRKRVIEIFRMVCVFIALFLLAIRNVSYISLTLIIVVIFCCYFLSTIWVRWKLEDRVELLEKEISQLKEKS
jgi:Flp pilus assembly protein TadB